MINQSTRVQIYTSELSVDPNIYEVENQTNSTIYLKMLCGFCNGTGSNRTTGTCKTCIGTGIAARHRIHQTRIAKVFDSHGDVIFESSLGRSKTMATSSKKEAAALVDLNTLKAQGELWSKAVNFDHSAIKVEAHVLIAADKRLFQVFNTYNGALGKKGKTGKQYSISDDKAYDHKVAQLAKLGYVKQA